MALKDQPYLPLYINDILTDEKLRMCSPQSYGVYLLLMCVLHKQEIYGKLLLKQRHKQSKSKSKNFAYVLSKHMPFNDKEIEDALLELEQEGVIEVTENALFQKRMVKDGSDSLAKSELPKLGGVHSARLYGKSGKLFWMSDYKNIQKVGASINSQNRLYRIRSDYKLKSFNIVEEFSVEDMGIYEDLAAEYFAENIDGEFLNISYTEMIKKFETFKYFCSANWQAKQRAKTRANPDNEYEYETKANNNNTFSTELSNTGGVGDFSVAETFEKFWKIYDKNIGRVTCEHLWIALTDDERYMAIDHAIKYISSNPDKKFRANPENYLEKKMWNDEIIESKPVKNGNSKNPTPEQLSEAHRKRFGG